MLKRVKPWGLSFLFFIYLNPALAEDTVASHDMQERVQACTPCHGPGGQGTKDVYFPRLAGKPSGYLFNQLIAFKNGRRHYPPMNYLLAYLPDSYLRGRLRERAKSYAKALANDILR